MRYLIAALAVLAFCCPAVAQNPTFTVTANWTAPTQHTDGSPISGLTGYVVYYSAAPRPTTCIHATIPNPSASGSQRAACNSWVSAAGKVEVDSASTTQQVLTDAQLAGNTEYHFSVTAKKGAVESQFSNQASATTPDTRLPGAPTNVTVEITFNAGT